MRTDYDCNTGQMTLTDRVAIEVGIAKGDSFAKIGKTIRRHPATISREIKENRTLITGTYPYGNDCKFFASCHRKQLCGESICTSIQECKRCKMHNCHDECYKYESAECYKTQSPPYVCNACYYRNMCKKTRYYYNARHAEAVVTRRRSASRMGARLSSEQIKEMEKIIRPLLNKGQPLAHIYSEHEDEMPVSLRTVYQYIDKQQIRIRSIDLRRKVGYKQRKIKSNHEVSWGNCQYRIGRTYDDYVEVLTKKFKDNEVVEMDTVNGCRETGKRLLTMIFRKNSVMLLFLMPNRKAESVIGVFDYLEAGLGLDCFQRLFPIILTDNGSEFKRVDDLEYNAEWNLRTSIYYCDPMASWQKPHIEKNHEFIRYVIPKGKSFSPYTQEEITLLMNHINSIKRPSLNYKAPYELIDKDDEDMKALMQLLKMHLIPPDEVHLRPDLFR